MQGNLRYCNSALQIRKACPILPRMTGQPLRWDDVRLFLALHRGRNLQAAGRKLGVDASTLSRRLAALEETLGAPLFDRTRTGLAATFAAEQVLEAALEMERASLRFSTDAGGLETRAEGLVRLAATPGLAEGFLAPLLPKLFARHPGLRLELDASVTVTDLTRREADLALRTIRPLSGELQLLKLTGARWLPMASKRLARQLGPLRTLGDAPWIAWGPSLAHIPPARWLKTFGPAVEPLLSTSSYPAQRAAVLAGVGVALLVEQDQGAGAVPVPLGRGLSEARAALPRDDLWLVGHRALRQVPRVAAVWTFLAEAFGHGAAGG
jgi:DNA-binding transcriptional LysR family regulator